MSSLDAPRKKVYKVFNDAESSPASNAKFSYFQRLPVELRTQIWRECIPSQRFIRIQLDCDRGCDQPRNLYRRKNQLGNTVSGSPYQISRGTTPEWAPESLLAVGREASIAFQRLCRVRVPFSGREDSGFLHICPERDTLYITSDSSVDGVPVALHFLHDLVAHDPQGIGITRLALGGPNDSRWLAEVDPSKLPLPARESITRILSSSLRCFYPVVKGDRNIAGMFTSPHACFHQNRSLPIMPATKSFTRLKRDPRPIGADLTYVSIGHEPRRQVYFFKRCKSNFGVQRSIEVSYLLALVFEKPQIATRESLVDFLRLSDNQWTDLTERTSQQVWGERMTKEEYERQWDCLPQAAGLWSLPEEAFGDVPDERDGTYMDHASWYSYKTVRDLSKVHPELWVFNLV